MIDVDLPAIETYIATSNPHLSYLEVQGLASEAAALLAEEMVVYGGDHRGRTMQFLSGYTGFVTPSDGKYAWRVIASGKEELACGTTDTEEEAYTSVEAMVQTFMSEGV